MRGFGAVKWSVAGISPCSNTMTALINPATPEADSRWPMFPFTPAERAKLFLACSGAKGFRQGGDFDRIAERGAGAVSLDIADGRDIDTGQCLRGGDHLGLAIDTRRHVADLGRAVVVDGKAANDRVDVIAIAHRFVGALEHDQADTVAENGSTGGHIKRTAAALRRNKTALFGDVATLLRKK